MLLHRAGSCLFMDNYSNIVHSRVDSRIAMDRRQFVNDRLDYLDFRPVAESEIDIVDAE